MSLSVLPESNLPLTEVPDPTLVGWGDYSNYRLAEYHLKSALSFKCPIIIKSIHNVINIEDKSKFESSLKGNQWTYGWYIFTELNDSNYMKKIAELKTKGFTMHDKSFVVGSINQQDMGAIGHYYYFLLCQIIIGNSLCIKKDRNKNRNIKDSKLPSYYSSYKLLTQDNMTISLLSKDYCQNASANLSFQYEILDNSLICPLYMIRFQQIKENIARDIDNYYCCRCRQKEAEVFCIVCEAYYDKDCYNIKHKAKGKNELNHGQFQDLKHKQKLGYCYEHIDRTADYYCITCKKPICSRCKIVINNKANMHNEHYVKDIYLAYDEESPNFFKADDIRQRCVKKLRQIKETVKKLIEKQVSIEKEIDYEFRDENDSIQSLTKEGKLKHFSVFAELNEMKNHLKNMDDYFHKCETAMIDANLKAEAIWVKDNYEEVISDMFNNFDEIKLDYKVNPKSFLQIKQTNLRIIKKLSNEQKLNYMEDKEESFVDKLITQDKQHIQTKLIVSLKNEKEETKKRKERQAKDREKQDFSDAKDPNKYALVETVLFRLKERAKLEMAKDVKKIIGNNANEHNLYDSNNNINTNMNNNNNNQ